MGLVKGSIGILALVETPRGILHVYDIASASPRIMGISFGAEDYALEMGISRTKEGSEIYYPRVVIALACHAAGVLALDGVYTDVKDTEGIIKETKAVRQMGFQGKTVIHPDQITLVNQVFTPAPEEIAQARRVIEVFETAVAQGQASIALDGKMVDVPVAERARKLLALADFIAQKSKIS
jgi:citrate lyase subunit beta/citryl-CoA lyase